MLLVCIKYSVCVELTYQQYGIHVLYSTRPNRLQYSYEYVRYDVISCCV